MQEDSICSQSSDLTSSDESFCLQIKIQHTQGNTKISTPYHHITNLAYRLKPHHIRNQYLRARLNTCANVNIIPASVYKLVFQDPHYKKLAHSKLEIGTYTINTVKGVGSCVFYLVHPDTKCLQEVTFYVTSYNGSVLLSCATTLALGLIQPHTRLDYLPCRASHIPSSADHPKNTKPQISVYVPKKESEVSNGIGMVSKLITSKEQILANYSDVFDGIECFPGSHYHIQVDPSVIPKQTPCQLIPVNLKESFKKEIDKMLKAGVLKPVNQATPWINSLVLVEGKDKQRNLKLRICLDLTNLNKAIVCEPYHFTIPEDIAQLLAEACVITVCDCRKGYWSQQLDEASSFLTMFNTELRRIWCTVMIFGAKVASDVFQQQLYESFGKLKQAIIIADDIMVVGYKPYHSDHDQAFTNLLQTAQKCNVKLNYDNLQCKLNEVDFLGETYDSGRWDSFVGHPYCYSQQETSSYTKPYTQRTFGS